MPVPPIEPPHEPNWFDLNWIVAAIGGVIGAATSAAIFVWHTATTVANMKSIIRSQGADIKRLEKDLSDIIEEQKLQHNANQQAIAALRDILNKQPTKDDLRDFTGWFREEISEIRRSLNRS